MRKLFLLFCFAVAIISANAQNKLKTNSTVKSLCFSGGINLGLPVGNYNDTHSFGAGVELQTEYNLLKNLSVYGNIGYTNFFAKNRGGEFEKMNNRGFIPVLAGIKIYPSQYFFAGAKAGYSIFSGKENSGFALDYQPQIGYNTKKFQAALGYNVSTLLGESISNLSFSLLHKF